mgnify:CR=1 FL=1
MTPYNVVTLSRSFPKKIFQGFDFIRLLLSYLDKPEISGYLYYKAKEAVGGPVIFSELSKEIHNTATAQSIFMQLEEYHSLHYDDYKQQD